ncbi:zinc finger protein 831 [Anguilla rostrata]|uniref:zinc finger protein 831 n=1 Tax=Anguilla rostrata TaxID=7938 RepID=UPI0030CDB38B
METSKQGFVSIPAPGGSVTAQGEDRMHETQAPLTAMYLQTLGRLPLYPQMAHPGPPTSQDAVALPLSISPLPTKQALPLLTFHITSGMHLPQQGQRSGVAATPTRPKSAGKHMCPHCGRDCLKPSVLEKHLRCHTGERPYPCTICGIAFKTQSNLYKHKRTQAHARLSSESEKGSFSSQESIPGSGDTCSSSPSLGAQSEDLESFEREVCAPPVTPCITSSSTQPPAALGKIGSDTGWALHQAALVGLILAPVNGNQEKLSSIVQKGEPLLGVGTAPAAKPPKAEGEQKPPSAPLTPNRHLFLQRQEATFFSKQWESSTSRGKSQSHDSTDSGFSECNEQNWNSSPSSTLHDHSMESLTESSMEHQEDVGVLENPREPVAAAGAKSRVSMLEKRKLEERISKLISENETLVDDKRLENVRPRKTVLSKQGSIDLPMPYTYKDSFHFEMRTSKQMSMASSQQSPDWRVKQALYNSVPTQQSTSLDHTPLTRSSSLPFSLGSPGLERSSQHRHYQREAVPVGRRDSSGQLYSGEFVMKSVDQQSSHHRSLVRQSAVDCLPAGEGLNVTSSVEESYPSSLGSDGDSIDAICESGGGKCRRKKAQKFSYNKWHMYGGGTFTKLYNTEKGSDHGSLRAKKAVVSTEQGKVHEIQSRNTASLPEPVTSAVSTAEFASAGTSIQTTHRTQCLPHSRPSTCGSQPAHGHISQLSSEPNLRRPSLSNPSSTMHHCVVRQGSLPAPDSTNGSRASLVKSIIQKEQNTEHNTTPQCLSHLPSERKKQRTEDDTGMLVDIMDLGEKRHNVLASMISKADDNSLVRPSQPSLAFCSSDTPKYTHPTKRGDSNKLQLQHQSSRMDLNLCFISRQMNQRPFQAKEHDSLPSLVNVGRLCVPATPSVSALTKSSFLPKYQLKLPHSAVSEQSLPATPALEQRLRTIPASEQGLTVIPTLEQDITAIPVLEKSLTSIPAIDSEQSLPSIPTPTSEQSLPPIPTITSEQRLPPIPTPTSEQNLPSIPTPTSEQSLPPIPTPTSEQSFSPIPTPTSEQNLPPIPTPTSEQSLAPIPTPTSEQSLPPIPTPTSEQSLPPIPAPTSEQNLPPIPTPTSEQSLAPIPTPTSEQSLPPIRTPTSAQSLPPIPTPTSEQNLLLIPTPTSEQNLFLIPTPTSEQSIAPIPTPTSEQSLPPIPTSTSEQSHTSAPTIAPKTSNTSKPKPAIKQNHSPTSKPPSTHTPTALSTPSEACAASHTTASGLSPTSPSTSGHIHTARPTLTSEQSHNVTPTPIPEMSHTAASTLGQMHTSSPQHSATCTATPKLSNTATPNSVCANCNTHFPMVESLSAGQVIVLKGVSQAASEETDYVKTGDIQIFLQIISDDQLSLTEAQLSTQDSQLEASVCQDISRAAVENNGAEIQQQSVSQQLNISQYAQLLADNAEGRSATDVAHTSLTHQASSAQLAGPSIPSYCEIFSHTEQHQEYQSCESSPQKNFPLLKSIPTPSQDFTNQSAHTGISEGDQTSVVSGHEAGGSELRKTEGQFACLRTVPHTHNQCRPADYGLPPLKRNSERPNQEPSKTVSVNTMGVCCQGSLPQQRITANTADCPVLLYSQAPPSSMASSTATVDRSPYPRPYIPDLRSVLADTHTKTEKRTLTDTKERGYLTFPCTTGTGQQHQKLLMEMPLAVQKNAVNAAAVPPLHMDCRDPLTAQGPKNKMLSAHKHHKLSPPPKHVWDVARCPDGIFSSDPKHCQNASPSSAPSRMERPTSVEPVGVGDTSSTSHLSPASNRLFIHPRSETAHPTAFSQHSVQTSTCEGPSLFQGSITQSPAVRQCETDAPKETQQGVLGCGSLLTDLSQQGTHTAVSPLTPNPGLLDSIQMCLPSVTQELPQQATSENAIPGSVPPEPTAQQQVQNERHVLEALAHNSSTEPCLQASHPTPRASQQEPFSASLPGQHKLCLAAGISLSPSAAADMSSGKVLVHVSVQHTPLNQRVPCSTGKQSETKCGFFANEAVANSRETSGGFCMVAPGSCVAQAGVSTVRQSTEASSPSFLCPSQDRKVLLSQDREAGTGTSTEKSQLPMKSSNTQCGLLTGPSGKVLSGGGISSLTSSQMQVSSNEPQDRIASHQNLEQNAPKDNMATGQEDMVLDNCVSSPRCASEGRQSDGALICASADTQKGSQAIDAGHLSASGTAAQQEQEAQASSQSLEEQADREPEEQGSRQRETTERGGVEETDSGEMEKRGLIDPCTSPTSEPHKGATSEEDVRDILADNGSLSYRDSSVFPYFPQTPTQRETTAAHTFQLHTHAETSILHILQTPTESETPTQSETSALQTPQTLTQSEAPAVHTFLAHRDSRCHGAGQGPLRHYSDVKSRSTEWGVHGGPCPALSAAQPSHTPESCPLPMNAGHTGCGMVAQAASRGMAANQPLQRTFLSVESRVQHEGLRETAQASARRAAERSEQPAPDAACAQPFFSHSSAAHCSLSLSVRASEASVRAAHSSLEEADTSSSDDEGRLVIELE